jgi:transcriptional regulator with XRE-family HTH domain
MNIGQGVKKAREQKGITQKELAERLYFDPSLVCKWEKGQKRVLAYELIAILEILEMSLDEFKNMC